MLAVPEQHGGIETHHFPAGAEREELADLLTEILTPSRNGQGDQRDDTEHDPTQHARLPGNGEGPII